MKAVRVSKTDSTTHITVEDIPKPSPKDGELLVQIKASFVQPSDILNANGGFPITSFPRTVGRDFAGTVVEGPEHWKGKNVYGTSGNTFSFSEDGAHAEFAVLKPDAVAGMPKNLSFAQAAAVGIPFTTAMLVLSRARAKVEDVVMVLGATGSVGSATIQVAKAMGCKTITVGRHGTDVDSTDDPELQRAKDLTDGKGPNVVVDTVGDFALTRAAFNVLAGYGRLVTITAPRKSSTELPIDILSLYRRQIELIGCNSIPHSQAEMATYMNILAEHFDDGKLEPPAEDTMNLIGIDQASDAYSGKIKRAVIVFGG